MKRTLLLVGAVLALTLGVTSVQAQGTFEILTDLGESFFGHYLTLSSDGEGIAANSNTYWTPDTGWITQDEGTFGRITGDGMKVIGTLPNDDGYNMAAVWDPAGGWNFIDPLPYGEPCDAGLMTGYAGNFDGTIAVGLAWVPSCRAEAFKWTEGVGTIGLGRIEDRSSRATDVSDDGSMTVGFAELPDGGYRRAAIWTDDIVGPQLILGEDIPGECLGVDSDGMQICGTANTNEIAATGFYWSEESGYVDLGMLPNDPINGSTALGIADNGWIVGFNSNAFWGYPEAFIWTPEEGLMPFSDFLDMHGVEYPEGTYFYSCTDISADATTIVGNFLPDGAMFLEAFKVILDDVVSIDFGDENADPNDLPQFETQLAGAHPNPFNPQTNIMFTLASEQRVKLSVFDVTGKQIVELANDVFGSGEHAVVWNGKDTSGRDVSSGTYMITMETEDAIRSNKMMLVR